jgi:hypothetical protein
VSSENGCSQFAAFGKVLKIKHTLYILLKKLLLYMRDTKAWE